jgi:hypothetical protein
VVATNANHFKFKKKNTKIGLREANLFQPTIYKAKQLIQETQGQMEVFV